MTPPRRRNSKQTKVESEPSYMVQIPEPKIVRKDLLESLREVILIMQAYEQFKRIQEDKVGIFQQMSKDVKELNGLISKLKKLVPKGKLKSLGEDVPRLELPKEEPKPKLVVSKGSPTKVAPTPKLNELDNLEGQLRDIERQLKSIN